MELSSHFVFVPDIFTTTDITVHLESYYIIFLLMGFGNPHIDQIKFDREL